MGLPVWTYEIDGIIIEKTILLPHGQNTVHVCYRLLKGEGKCGSSCAHRSTFAA